MSARSKDSRKRSGRADRSTMELSLHLTGRGMTLASIADKAGVHPGEGSFCVSEPFPFPNLSRSLRLRLKRARAGQSVLKIHSGKVLAPCDVIGRAHELFESLLKRHRVDLGALNRVGIRCYVFVGVFANGPMFTIDVPLKQDRWKGIDFADVTIYWSWTREMLEKAPRK